MDVNGSQAEPGKEDPEHDHSDSTAPSIFSLDASVAPLVVLVSCCWAIRLELYEWWLAPSC